MCGSCGCHKRRRCQIVEHIMSQHLKVSYRCPRCERKFCRARDRRKHLFEKHDLALENHEIAKMAAEMGLEY